MQPFDSKYFSLLKEIAVCQFRLKDQSTFFGFLWSFLHPLLMLVVLFLFFHMRVGKSVDHYAVFLLIGIIHFTHFSNSTSASMTVLQSMKQLVTNVIVPKELLVIGSVLANTLEFFISMPICIAIAYFSGIPLSWSLALLPLLYLLEIMLVLWVSFFMSCLYVFVRDTGHIYQVFLRVLFFMTPIFYTAGFLGNGMARYIITLNPLAYVIHFARSVIMNQDFSPPGDFILFIAVNAILVVLSIYTFKRLEPKFAEYV
ncbi:ABC transporter permease [bacterium]|nr:ABC transporter permease [bacterium]MCI0607172.1 ABC transporter permease [bacterium]